MIQFGLQGVVKNKEEEIMDKEKNGTVNFNISKELCSLSRQKINI